MPQLPERRKAPRWALWFGVVAGIVIIAGLVWAGALAVADSQTEPADPSATGDMHAQSVVEGMCLESVDEDGPVGTVTVVPCDTPHTAQVVAATDLKIEVYPGSDALVDEGEDYCTPRIPRDLPTGASWTMWIPSEDSWRRGDRTVSCVVVSSDTLTESLVDSPTPSDDGTQTQNA